MEPHTNTNTNRNDDEERAGFSSSFYFEQSLQQSKNLTNQMVHILDSFETRLSKLEQKIGPIQSEATNLKNIYTNIQSTLKSIDKTVEIFNISSIVAPRIAKGVNHDLESYLSCLDKINDAITYLNKNRSFKSSQQELVILKQLRQDGLARCEKEFTHTLIHCNIELDFSNKDQPLPETFTLITPNGALDLKKMIQRFDDFEYEFYLKEYSERRSKFLQQNMRKAYPSTIKEDEGYQPGSHPYNYFLIVSLKLLQSEKIIALKLLSGSEQFNLVFPNIVEACIDLLFQFGEITMKVQKNVDKGFGVYALLDIWSRFSSLIDKFKQTIESDKVIEELSEFSNRFSTSARKCFETFEQYVKNDNSGVPPDGTVHELTSNACAFLKRLCDYKDSLVLFWKQKDYESKRKDMDLGKFMVQTLTELKFNLIAKSKKEKTKGTIFLLNNFYFIKKTVTTSDLWNMLPSKTSFEQEYEDIINEQRDIYKSSWKNACSFLDDSKIRDLIGKKMLNSSEKKKLKSKFKGFNEEIQTAFETHKSHFIPDDELRATIRNDTRKMVIDPYTKFYENFGELPFSKKHKGDYVKFTKETLNEMLGQFFEGHQSSKKTPKK